MRCYHGPWCYQGGSTFAGGWGWGRTRHPLAVLGRPPLPKFRGEGVLAGRPGSVFLPTVVVAHVEPLLLDESVQCSARRTFVEAAFAGERWNGRMTPRRLVGMSGERAQYTSFRDRHHVCLRSSEPTINLDGNSESGARPARRRDLNRLSGAARNGVRIGHGLPVVLGCDTTGCDMTFSWALCEALRPAWRQRRGASVLCAYEQGAMGP